jgi:hypothetical protein
MHTAIERSEAGRPAAGLAGAARCLRREPPGLPSTVCSGAQLSISAETYARLLSLADQAPLDCLPLTPRTLDRAKTLGYNQIGQIRNTPPSRLLADLGEDRAQELQRALHDFGMR